MRLSHLPIIGPLKFSNNFGIKEIFQVFSQPIRSDAGSQHRFETRGPAKRAVNDKYKQPLKSPIFTYTIKCLLGVSIGYWLYIRFPGHQFFWSLISIILVIAPDPRHSSQLAFDRMKANVIGSLTGLFLFLIGEPGLLLISLGVAITIGLCTLFNLMNASRSSLAALLIVTMYEKNGNSWHIALERVGCVIIGCLIGLVISLVFGYIAKE